MPQNDLIYCWGKNEEGQMGMNISSEELLISPKLFEVPISSPIKKICCGDNHSLILTDCGYVYSSGSNSYGQLGRSGRQRIFSLISDVSNIYISDIACGANHSLLQQGNRTLYGFGNNDMRQVLDSLSLKTVPSPRLIQTFDHPITCISCGFNCSFAIISCGDVYSWGSNSHGQLGIGISKSPSSWFSLITSLKGIGIVFITGGLYHSAALSSNGFLYTWGSNSHGQTGHSDENMVIYEPKCLKQFENIIITSICCGSDHTVALSKAGQVFTFGSGRSGQLGHNSTTNVISPRQVMELCGTFVSMVSSGRHHTIVFTPKNSSFYAFGSCNFGQCGFPNIKTCQSTPLPTKLPTTYCSEGNKILPIFPKYVTCGGDFCMIIFSFNENYRITSYKNAVPAPLGFYCYGTKESYINHGDIVNYANISLTQKEKFINQCQEVFSNITSLNHSFRRSDRSSFRNHKNNIDYEMFNEFMVRSAGWPSLNQALNNCFESIFKQLISYNPPHHEGFRFLFFTLLFPHCHSLNNLFTFAIPLDYSFKWGKEQSLVNILPYLPPSLFVMLVESCIKHLVYLLQPFTIIARGSHYLGTSKEEMIENFCRMIDSLYNINKKYDITSYTIFYIKNIQKEYPLYQVFCQSLVDGVEVELLRYPYLLEVSVKATFFLLKNIFATIVRHSLIPISSFTLVQALYVSQNIPISAMFRVEVRRSYLLEDALKLLARKRGTAISRFIFVQFIGEEALDQGGVKKEFFFLITRELFGPQYGLFTVYADSQCIWFPDKTLAENNLYYLMGLIISLAVFNNIILDLNFPMALFYKLIGEPITIKHLEELDPSLAKGLQYMLDYDGDDFEDVFCLTFEIERISFDETYKICLLHDGENMPVTQNNKHKYVDLYIDYIFNRCCQTEFQEFEKGFFSIDTLYYKKYFNPYELREVIIGCNDFDFYDLQKITSYLGEYHQTHPVILDFWDVVHNLDSEHKNKFLQFVTGAPKMPLAGISSIPFAIQSSKVSPDHLPVAHTCVNLIDLPMYPNKEDLKKKLIKAIENCEGFGLV